MTDRAEQSELNQRDEMSRAEQVCTLTVKQDQGEQPPVCQGRAEQQHWDQQSQERVSGQDERIGRAEQCRSSTQPNTQSPTIQGAVARYVGVLIGDNISLQKLTNPNLGPPPCQAVQTEQDQREKTSRAEHPHADRGRAELEHRVESEQMSLANDRGLAEQYKQDLAKDRG